jgi:cytochrome c peroxidase
MHTRAIVVALVVVGALLFAAAPALAAHLTDQAKLGEMLFFDKNLSLNANQSCATCHGPAVGWTGPDASINAAGAVYEGSDAGMFGNRKPPAAAYAGDSPILHWDGTKWVGGMFWDGRATGETLGDPLAEQAKGPFLNPREQAIPDAATLVAKVQASTYAGLFEHVWGPGAFSPVDMAYDNIGRSIAAYERSSEVSEFTSKYDAWLAGKARLTGQEKNGLALFMGKAKCGTCHVPPRFTDFTYDNLGIPKNPLNPVYDWAGSSWVDRGLGDYLATVPRFESQAASEMGKFKVPTLRNVDKRPSAKFVKAYGHNGYFKSLESIVHFYNTRDVRCAGWPAPEVAVNVNTTAIGNLGLNRGQEKAIVAFLKTLSDGYRSASCH